MTDGPDSAEGRVESLLRRWGAERALEAGDAPPPAPVETLARPGRVGPGLRRWVPAIAAGLLLAASAGFYAASRRGPISAAVQRQLVDQAGRLRAALAAAEQRLAAREKALAGLAGLAGQVESLRRQLEQERTTFQADLAQARADANSARAAARAVRARLAAAEERLAALAIENRALAANAGRVDSLRRELNEMQCRLDEARSALDAAQERQRRTAEALAAAQSELAGARARHEAVVGAFRRAFLSSVAPGRSALAARQQAARARRLLDRVAAASDRADDQALRALLERLEVVLTRLDLVNADAAGAAAAFERLMQRGDLAGRIDRALSAEAGDEEIRALLLEAKLILAGADDAG